jgi:uncharacterized protein
MQRNAEQQLLSWLGSKDRKPLVIRGARQVGKSTLVRLFAESQGRNLLEVNLERHRSMAAAFSSMDVNSILHEAEVLCANQPFDPKNSILFLDEIQAVPEAIPALRYFYEERPDVPVIAAGSLLEFALEKANFSMPVGRIEYLYIYPMTFEEFLSARKETVLLEEMRSFVPGIPFSAAAHERLLLLLRDYFFVGGMPQAVKEYIAQSNVSAAFPVHGSILETYRDDFGKYASSRDLDRMQRMFDALPGQVTNKFKYVKVLAHEQPRDVKTALLLLAKAGLVTQVFHTSCSGLPLATGTDDRIFKILMLDVGLLNASMGTYAIPPSQLLAKAIATEGRIAEQVVGQHLLHFGNTSRRPFLYYWVREGKTSNAEVDYIIQQGGMIIPVEVKAGKSGSLRSLHQFIAEKNSSLALRFDLNPPSDLEVEHSIAIGAERKTIRFKLLSLPIYMVGESARILSLPLGDRSAK